MINVDLGVAIRRSEAPGSSSRHLAGLELVNAPPVTEIE
jgi:hypothetical protein